MTRNTDGEAGERGAIQRTRPRRGFGPQAGPIRVALVTASYLPNSGGLEISVHDLAVELQRRGLEAVVVTDQPTPWARERGTPTDVEVHHIALHLSRATGRLRPATQTMMRLIPRTVSLARLLRRLQVDLVHVHYISENAALATFACRLIGVPMVVTARGGDLGRLTLSRRHRFIASIALKKAAFVTAVSSDLLTIAASFVPAVATKGKVISSGLYTTFFAAPPEATPLLDPPYLLSVGRLYPLKGHDVLLRAFRRVMGSFPGLRLVIAGSGPQREELLALAGRLGLSESVVFFGRVGQEEIRSLLSGCEMLVMPSREEGIARALLEAMAAAKPAVATEVGGMPEALAHGQAGLLVPSEDEAALAEGIMKLMKDPILRSRMGRRGQELAERHDWQHVAEEYVSIYRQVTGSRPAAPEVPQGARRVLDSGRMP